MGAPQPIVGTNLPTVGTIRTALEQPQFAGSLLTGQRVGANTRCWHDQRHDQPVALLRHHQHFDLLERGVRHLPSPTLAIPRMGVFDPDPDNATRVEADIDLYASRNPA